MKYFYAMIIFINVVSFNVFSAEIMNNEKPEKFYTERIKRMMNNNELKFSDAEKELMNSFFKGERKTEQEILKLIENENAMFNKEVISDFMSFILEENLYDITKIVYINKFINKYNELPNIISFYLWYDNNLRDKAPSFWLDPCMTILINDIKKSDEEILFGEMKYYPNSFILTWVAKNKDIGKYKYLILNLPFDDKFLIVAFELYGVSYSMTKEVLNIKEGEHYDSLFDWYYREIIVSANLELEWFELLEKRETQTNLALKSKEKFLKKEKEMFLEKQNEILKLRENKK